MSDMFARNLQRPWLPDIDILTSFPMMYSVIGTQSVLSEFIRFLRSLLTTHIDLALGTLYILLLCVMCSDKIRMGTAHMLLLLTTDVR